MGVQQAMILRIMSLSLYLFPESKVAHCVHRCASVTVRDACKWLEARDQELPFSVSNHYTSDAPASIRAMAAAAGPRSELAGSAMGARPTRKPSWS